MEMDVCWKEYFRDDARYADVINGIGCAGQQSLHEMLDWTGLPEKLKQFVSDYPIHIVKIREFENTDVFQTDVKQVFDFIRCSGDRKALAELVKDNESFRRMEEDAYEVVTM